MKGEQIIQRATALTIPCPYCGAEVERECFNPLTGSLLEHQPAHNIRMRESGAI